MFEQNNKIIYYCNKAADMVILSVLWCLCCLPVVTIGASCSALYHTVMKSIREDKAYAAAAFWSSFKSNLKQCIPFTVLSALAAVAFGATAYYCYKNMGGFMTNIYMICSAFCFLLLFVVQIHAYSLIGRFDLNRHEFYSVLVKLCGTGIFRNILLLGVLAFAVEIAFSYPPLLFIVPSGYTFIISYQEEAKFAKFIRYQTAGEELREQAQKEDEAVREDSAVPEIPSSAQGNTSGKDEI